MSNAEKELSWDALAKRLGVSRQSLVRWRELEGAPQDRNMEAWKKFAENKPAMGGHELKEEKTRHEIELLKARIDREKRRVIPAEEVNALLLHLATGSRTLLYQFLETEAPPKLDGMSAAQMRPILREMADAICEKMADAIKEFEQR